MKRELVLHIRDLYISFHTAAGKVNAIRGVNLDLYKGETLALVGESGSGKSTIGRTIIRLYEPTAGRIIMDGVDISGKLRAAETKHLRTQIQMIFQDPMACLNPRKKVIDIVAQGLDIHHMYKSAKERQEKVYSILETVGLSDEHANRYPHQFSGGRKQRVVIAIALACNPRVLIADEPTTALDVTIQAQVLETIRDLRQKFHTSMLLITHDLGVIAQNCEYVSIIYAGEIVETGTVHDIFGRKLHPYTQGLFSSIPNINETVTRLIPINGLMPDPTALPEGCAFCERCKYAEERCSREHPSLYAMGGEENTHQVRCFRYEQNGEGR